ncbi:MAG TPA: serine/threonine-protein kinase, partial [Miltoncostaea sp.]|nr:serine/threonine-protein kinase [Miltoncostaea sp.]
MDRADPSRDRLLPARYRDPVLIAVGGMGAVYRAHDERLGRDVAVKVPSDAVAGDETAGRRFRREAVSAARIHHPNVATVFDVGEHRGRSYMVMQLATGGTIADRLAQERPPPAVALDWIAQTAAALDAAHAAGVVHRDVKPANLLLDADGRVKVADFGVARVLGDQGATLTAAGTVLGTSGYAAPEQAEGRPATAASDVYSLAAVAFELLTGARPYAPRVGIAELTAHASAPVPSARAREPGLPPAVDAVLTRGLAKAPEERFPTPGAFAAALTDALAPPAQATAVMPVAEPPARAAVAPRRRGRAAIIAAAIVAVAGGVTAAAVLTGGRDDPGAAPSGASGASTVVRTVVRNAPTGAPRTVTVEAPAAPAAPAG